MIRSFLRSFLLLLFTLAIGFSVFSQVKVEAIATSRITVQTEQTNEKIATISTSLAEELDLGRLYQKVEKSRKKLKLLDKETNDRIGDEIGVHYLGDIKIKWDSEEKKLRNLEGDVSKTVSTLDGYRAELEVEKFKWNLTIDQLKEEKASDGLIKSSRELVKSINTVNRAVRDTGLSAMDLLSEIAILKQQIITNKQLVTSQAQLEIEGIFEKNRPHFFAELFSPQEDSVEVRSQLMVLWQYSIKDTVYFLKKHKNIAVIQLVLLFLLIGIFYLVQANYKSWRVFEDTSLRATLSFIESPIFTSLFITMFITFWIYPGLPATISEFNAMLLTLVMMLILPKIASRFVHPLLYMFAAVFVMLQFQSILVGHDFIQRVLLLTENVIAVGVMTWFYIKNRQELKNYLNVRPLHRWLFTFLWIAVIFLIVSLLANVFGYVKLSEFLTEAIIRSFVIAVLLYISERIMNGVFKIILQSRILSQSYVINKRRDLIHNWILTAYRFFATYIWLGFLLNQFAIREDVVISLKRWKEETWIFGSVEITFSNIIDFVLIIIVCWYLSLLIKTILEEELLVRLRLKRGVPMAIAIVTRYSILTFGFFLAVAAAGLNLEKLSFVAGALGVGIGFGLQNLVGNFVSGMILIFERPILIGDVIVVGEFEGVVTEIGMRSSRMRTWAGAEVIIPNAELISERVTNLTLSDKKRRIEHAIDVESTANPRMVIEQIKEAISKQPDVLKDPAPMVLFKGQFENRLQFRVLYWLAENLLLGKAEVSLNIHENLRKAGIDFALPESRINLKATEKEGEEAKKPSSK